MIHTAQLTQVNLELSIMMEKNQILSLERYDKFLPSLDFHFLTIARKPLRFLNLSLKSKSTFTTSNAVVLK